jgi:hypothetical protein
MGIIGCCLFKEAYFIQSLAILRSAFNVLRLISLIENSKLPRMELAAVPGSVDTFPL